MIAFIPDGCKKILDVGCGEGRFGRHVKEKFPDVEIHGIEKNRGAALKAKTNIDKVLNNDIHGAIKLIKNNFYDCIVFNDVLEHLPDPVDVLKKIKPKLKKGGMILSSIPNVRFYPVIKELLLHKNWSYTDAGILDYTHLRFFTEKSIHELFEAAGYRVCLITGINEHYFGRLFKLLNLIFLGKISDMKYLQFACLSKIKNDSDCS
jgi:2-polyprenyl-3-methyl-5-hydroxy-6-metoxy-1,4-benzoquinol methylase